MCTAAPVQAAAGLATGAGDTSASSGVGVGGEDGISSFFGLGAR